MCQRRVEQAAFDRRTVGGVQVGERAGAKRHLQPPRVRRRDPELIRAPLPRQLGVEGRRQHRLVGDDEPCGARRHRRESAQHPHDAAAHRLAVHGEAEAPAGTRRGGRCRVGQKRHRAHIRRLRGPHDSGRAGGRKANPERPAALDASGCRCRADRAPAPDWKRSSRHPRIARREQRPQRRARDRLRRRGGILAILVAVGDLQAGRLVELERLDFPAPARQRRPKQRPVLPGDPEANPADRTLRATQVGRNRHVERR